jgi:hypothetical protein
MSKLEFLATCPCCGDTHVEIKCKKPSFIVPTMTQAYCDHCESTVLFRVTLPRNRTSRGQIAFQASKITPSPKLTEMLRLKQELQAAAQSPVTESSPDASKSEI